jgi:predicted ester cyclase
VAFPDSRGTITSRVIDGNKAAAEVVWRGTNHGSLMGQAPTGKAVEVRAVVMIDTDGSKITRASHYIDVAGMMAQLGAAVS